MSASLHRTLSLPYWRRRPGRLFLVMLSIALGVATWVATWGLHDNLEKASRCAAAPPAGAADLHVTNGDAGVTLSLAGLVRQVPFVRSVRPVVIRQAVLPDLNQRPVTLLGMDLDSQSNDGSSWSVHFHERLAESFLTASCSSARLFCSGPSWIVRWRPR